MVDRPYRLSIDVSEHGALFDPARAEHVFRRYTEDFSQEAAEWTEKRVKRIFHEDFRHPTGYYEERVTTHRLVTGAYEVWDHGERGPAYGPWLEGIGSRNLTSRFRGYHAFRRAEAALRQYIDQLGDRIFMDRFSREL